MNGNQLTRYGAISKALPIMSPAAKVFFVVDANDSWYADTENDFKPDLDGVPRVYSTVDSAIGACVASRGDIILVAPGHAETVTATSIAHDVAGVKVIGLGDGSNRPTFTYGAAAATITVSAANGVWQNCRLIANFADVAAAFTVGAATNFQLLDCTAIDTSSILNFLSIVVTGATNNEADALTIQRCTWQSLATTANAFVSILANEARLLITDNFVNKAATNNAGQFITLSSKIISAAQILRNTLIVVGATGTTVGIFLTGSGTTSTGIVAYNLVSSLDTTSELIATAGTGLSFFENYYTGTADASGKLWPVVDAA